MAPNIHSPKKSYQASQMVRLTKIVINLGSVSLHRSRSILLHSEKRGAKMAPQRHHFLVCRTRYEKMAPLCQRGAVFQNGSCEHLFGSTFSVSVHWESESIILDSFNNCFFTRVCTCNIPYYFSEILLCSQNMMHPQASLKRQ